MRGLEPDDHPLRRLASWSWPLFRAFGVRVRMHWTTIFVPLLVLAATIRWLDPVEALAWTGAWTVLLYVVVWTHEMGHVWAGRSVGVQTREITLHPLGGLAHMQAGAPTPRAEILVALAGPLTHAVWFVLAGAPYFFLLRGTAAENTTWGSMLLAFLGLNAGMLFFNLLPFWPMDGGRVLRAGLATKMHPNHASLFAAYAGFAGAVVLGVTGIAAMIEADTGSFLGDFGAPLLLGIAITNFMACRMLLFEARWSDGPYQSAEPWRASLPQATWNLEESLESEPVRVEERRPRRTATAPAKPARVREPARPAPRPLQERIDELLDRINEVGGIENLPEAERRELAEASERLRRGR